MNNHKKKNFGRGRNPPAPIRLRKYATIGSLIRISILTARVAIIPYGFQTEFMQLFF